VDSAKPTAGTPTHACSATRWRKQSTSTVRRHRSWLSAIPGSRRKRTCEWRNPVNDPAFFGHMPEDRRETGFLRTSDQIDAVFMTINTARRMEDLMKLRTRRNALPEEARSRGFVFGVDPQPLRQALRVRHSSRLAERLTPVF
jgi:hypothetical protein